MQCHMLHTGARHHNKRREYTQLELQAHPGEMPGDAGQPDRVRHEEMLRDRAEEAAMRHAEQQVPGVARRTAARLRWKAEQTAKQTAKPTQTTRRGRPRPRRPDSQFHV